MTVPRRKILVAMSGGVDSSVAAAVLRDAGHDVVGVFMRMGIEGDDSGFRICTPDCGLNGQARGTVSEIRNPKSGVQIGNRSCCSAADAADARRVAGRLGIPFYVLNFAGPFAGLIDYFVAEYNRGRTPNPCVRCNGDLKFGKLFEYADAIGADAVATGHYARIVAGPAGPMLARGLDPDKDQSYVLFSIGRAQLGRVVLPLGEWTKDRVRARAAELGLPVADKPDSQDICFVPDNDYGRLLRERSGETVRPGPVLDADGRVVGEHPGHQHFTIGQRRGLRIAAGTPVYVTAIDPAANTVTVGSADALLRAELTCSDVNWLVDLPCSTQRDREAEKREDRSQKSEDRSRKAEGPRVERPACPFRAGVKIRYKAPAEPATVQPLAGGRARVAFDAPVSAVTPGQAAVFYDDVGCVLGGGWID